MTNDEALQELILLRQQVADFHSSSLKDSRLVLHTSPLLLPSRLGGNVPLEMSQSELSEAFDMSENLVGIFLYRQIKIILKWLFISYYLAHVETLLV
jgi:hypothetical protein